MVRLMKTLHPDDIDTDCFGVRRPNCRKPRKRLEVLRSDDPRYATGEIIPRIEAAAMAITRKDVQVIDDPRLESN